MQSRKGWKPLTLITKAEQLRRRRIKLQEIYERIQERKQMTKTTILQELAKITDNKELDVFEREIKYKQLINKIVLSLD